MPRGGHKKSSLITVLIAAGVLVLVLVGVFLFLKPASDPYRTIPELDVQIYLEDAKSVRGNTYRVQGEVSELLAWSEAKGRLISLRVETQKGMEFIPILLPPEFADINVQKGQSYRIKVEVVSQGFIEAREIQKS
ncbi:MAG: hypothetical protein AAF558_07700 [Verrucomicrobiota bacterium]